MSSSAKDNRIKTLEETIMDLGHDPNNLKGIKALRNKKEDDIAATKKQLRLPATMHPQTAELVQEKEAEDKMDLLMKMNQRIIQMEEELERALQGKQGESTSQPPQIAPIIVTLPPTQAATIPPIILASTTTTTTTDATTTTTIVPESSMIMEEMMKAIKKIEVQVTELKESKEKLAKI